MKKIFVGLSGGVDSSVTASLLKEQGYDVTGVFMKNWAQDLPGFECPWREDYTDAKRIAVQLGIPFTMVDYQAEYRNNVVNYLLDGYKRGETPNPDIMCNQEIKFKLFLDYALEHGADGIATGHYAKTDNGQLFSPVDSKKDQTYFLYRVEEDALKKALFPLAGYTKQQVRDMAQERGLITADKKDSMGICFVGKVDMREFLREFIDVHPGPVVNQHGKEIAQHDGVELYTIGQRHGLQLGGGLPYYVTDKDLDSRTVFVTTDIDDAKLWTKQLELRACHWINDAPSSATQSGEFTARTRHLGEFEKVQSIEQTEHGYRVNFEQEIRAISPGQSIVLYQENRVVGGGIVAVY